MGKPAIPDPNSIGPDTPLRLEIAAAIAFPDGGMTASGLRKEHSKGRLEFERIANKDFVTLKQIEEMRKKCALSNRQGLNLDPPGRKKSRLAFGSSETKDASAAQASARASAQRLRSRSRNTSNKPDGQPSATVIPLKS
jgi:hypothetical protein